MNNCERNLKIDLGCGTGTSPKGYIGIDIDNYAEYYEEGMFIQHDMRIGLPFCNNSCISIRCHKALSYFTPTETMGIIDECWRVLKKEGVMEIMARSKASDFGTPLHQQIFNIHSFDYLVKRKAFWWKDYSRNWDILEKTPKEDYIYFKIIPIK